MSLRFFDTEPEAPAQNKDNPLNLQENPENSLRKQNLQPIDNKEEKPSSGDADTEQNELLLMRELYALDKMCHASKNVVSRNSDPVQVELDAALSSVNDRLQTLNNNPDLNQQISPSLVK